MLRITNAITVEKVLFKTLNQWFITRRLRFFKKTLLRNSKPPFMRKQHLSPISKILGLTCLSALLVSFVHAEIPPQSRKIDALIEADLKRSKITPNEPANDEVFLRRVYLNAIGRIPTLEEAERYYSYDGPSRRGKIIEYLLKTEGYVSHTYNYWADILRVKTNMNGNTGAAYVEWIKQAIRDNLPYDEFVKQLITSEGKIWDNGAVGYYLRDAGMPLDNMSNTTQIFLGTQLVCAQCHNHPFDNWEQKDYYQMAAFTYGVDTRVDAKEELGINKLMSGRKAVKLTGNMNRALDDILEPLSYGAQDSEKQVKLPKDYQYDDFKPETVMKPNTMFGDDVKVTRKVGLREGYAAWMTSKDNPRFTRVIANRLWKRAFGLGLVEPADDFKDTNAPSNPELLDYLEETLLSVKYDMRKFMHIVYNTRTFQRAATVEEVPSDIPYHFQGPLLQRMSSEQLWDSMMVLAIPDPDQRLDTENQQKRAYEARELAEKLRKRDPKNILAQAEEVGTAMDKYDGISKRIRDELLAAQEADDVERVKALRKDLNQADKDRNYLIAEANKKYAGGGGDSESMMMGMSMMDKMAMKKKEELAKNQPKEAKKEDPWKGYGSHLMRASELPSPAPSGHFLSEFGQSDRDTIQNSHKNASVSQALMLLNSNVLNDIVGDSAKVTKEIRACMTPKEKQDTLFLSVLSRFPTDSERELAAGMIAKRGEKGYEDIVFALLNTSHFAFIE